MTMIPIVAGVVGYGISKIAPKIFTHQEVSVNDSAVQRIYKQTVSYIRDSYDLFEGRNPKLGKYCSVMLKDNLGVSCLAVGCLCTGGIGLQLVATPLLPIGFHFSRELLYMRFPREFRPYIMPSSVASSPYLPSAFFSLRSIDINRADLYLIDRKLLLSFQQRFDFLRLLEGAYESYKDKNMPVPSRSSIVKQMQLIQALTGPAINRTHMKTVIQTHNLTEDELFLFLTVDWLLQIIPQDLLKECDDQEAENLLILLFTELKTLANLDIDFNKSAIKELFKQASLRRQVICRDAAQERDYTSLEYEKLEEKYTSCGLSYHGLQNDFFQKSRPYENVFILGVHAILSRFGKEVLQNFVNGVKPQLNYIPKPAGSND